MATGLHAANAGILSGRRSDHITARQKKGRSARSGISFVAFAIAFVAVLSLLDYLYLPSSAIGYAGVLTAAVVITLPFYIAARLGKLAPVAVFIFVYALIFIILEVLSYIIFAFSGAAEGQLLFYETAGLGFSFLLAPFLYLTIYKRRSIGQSINHLGLGKESLKLRFVAVAVPLFLALILLSVATEIAGELLNTQINTNTNIVFAGAPIWFLIFAALIEPINEEVMFRGFMIKNLRFLPLGLGIIISSLLFAAGHVGYNSTFGIEVIAAFAFGMIAGYVFSETDSLYPSIIAHIAINSIGIMALLIIFR